VSIETDCPLTPRRRVVSRGIVPSGYAAGSFASIQRMK
jgi:hypothetical protein